MEYRKKVVASFDDLIFQGRNREYGAYQLRRKHKSVVITGTVIASLIAFIAVLIPFILRPDNSRILSGGGRYVQVTMEKFKPPEEEIYVPPPPLPPEKVQLIEAAKYIPPVVVDSVSPVEMPPPTVEEILAGSPQGMTDAALTGSGTDVLAGLGGPGSDEPFSFVEIMPRFRGGDLDTFREWVIRRTNYPQEAIDKGIKGKVFLTFIVEPDGSVSNVTVVQGVHPLIDNEAVKAIESSPAWSPGLQRGQPVRVRFSMSLNFTSN